MRFSLSSIALSSRLLTLSRVVNSKNFLPILDCLLPEVHDGQLIITVSDSENVMHGTLNLESCESKGDFAVNNHTILDAVKELPEQPLTLDVNLDEMKIHVTYQNGSYNLPILGVDEYPKVQSVSDSATTTTLQAEKLSDSLIRSLFATAQDELRPVMNGVYFDLREDGLAIVASDGHRFIRNKILSIKSDSPASSVLPKKSVSLLKNTLSKDGGDVIICFDERFAEIFFAEGNLVCRLIEGKYPNHNSVILQDNPNQVTINRKSLIGTLCCVLPFASDSSQLIRFHVPAGLLEPNAEGTDLVISTKEGVTCEYGGNPMSIGFKGSSMFDILNNLESDDVVAQLAGPSRAGVIMPGTRSENEDVLVLIMPMLLND